MKKIIGILILLSATLFCEVASATTFTYSKDYPVTINASARSASVTAYLYDDNYAFSTTTSYRYLLCKGTYNDRSSCSASSEVEVTVDEDTSKIFTFPNLTPNTKYTFFMNSNANSVTYKAKEGEYYEFKTDIEYTTTGSGTLTFNTVSGALKATYNVPATDTNTSYHVFYYPTLAAATNINGASKTDTLSTTGVKSGSIATTVPSTDLYYARLVGKNASGTAVFLTAPTETVLYYARTLKIDTADIEAEVMGQIDTTKHADFGQFIVSVYVDENTILTADGNEVANAFYTSTSQGGIKSDGSYSIKISNLQPSKKYYFRHVITSPSGRKEALADSFPSSAAYTPQGSIEKEADFEDRSYRLLAPFPGLLTVLDPDLCREQQKEGALGDGQVCGINEFINLILKILVGVTAVFLVVRIIVEGYNYVVTDVPFLKASAKMHLLESVFGLVLALSSYLILNTINPKLVAGEISIQQIELEIEEDIDIDPILSDGAVSIPSGTVAQCKEGIVKVVTKGGEFHACKTIQENFKKMIDDAWAAGINISGGGFRTRERQIALRKKNCGGEANVFIKSAKCDPLTARPGTSMHESGLAFDLTCDGRENSINRKKRPATKKCYDWLSANASEYGFKNLKSEDWHWSITGR